MSHQAAAGRWEYRMPMVRRRSTVRFRNGAPQELTCEARSEAHWTALILRGGWELLPRWEESGRSSSGGTSGADSAGLVPGLRLAVRASRWALRRDARLNALDRHRAEVEAEPRLAASRRADASWRPERTKTCPRPPPPYQAGHRPADRGAAARVAEAAGRGAAETSRRLARGCGPGHRPARPATRPTPGSSEQLRLEFD